MNMKLWNTIALLATVAGLVAVGFSNPVRAEEILTPVPPETVLTPVPPSTVLTPVPPSVVVTPVPVEAGK